MSDVSIMIKIREKEKLFFSFHFWFQETLDLCLHFLVSSDDTQKEKKENQ